MKHLLIIIGIILIIVVLFQNKHNEGFASTSASASDECDACPLKYVKIVPHHKKYRLIVKVNGMPNEESPKEFSTHADAVKFWNFLKTNNNDLKSCILQKQKQDQRNNRSKDSKVGRRDELLVLIRHVEKEIKDTNRRLSDLNLKLESNGKLQKNEHNTVRKLAEKTVKDAKSLNTLISNSTKTTNEVNNKLETVKSDETYLNSLLSSEEDKARSLELKNKMNETKTTLIKHANKLASLEEKINTIMHGIEANKTVLNDINAKLKNKVPKPKSDIVTIKKINKSLKKCPPCPMYASTHPVNVMEVNNQRVGSIIPLNQNLNIITD